MLLGIFHTKDHARRPGAARLALLHCSSDPIRLACPFEAEKGFEIGLNLEGFKSERQSIDTRAFVSSGVSA